LIKPLSLSKRTSNSGKLRFLEGTSKTNYSRLQLGEVHHINAKARLEGLFAAEL